MTLRKRNSSLENVSLDHMYALINSSYEVQPTPLYNATYKHPQKDDMTPFFSEKKGGCCL